MSNGMELDSTPSQPANHSGLFLGENHSPGAKLLSRIPSPPLCNRELTRSLTQSESAICASEHTWNYIYIYITRLMRFATAYTETS